MGDECGGQTENNVPHKFLTDKMVNCRNIWFREFWSQHHKCTFNVNASSDMARCTGEENLVDYEQEGLVPFVGNVKIFLFYRYILIYFFSLLKYLLFFYIVHRRKVKVRPMIIDLHRCIFLNV